MGKTKRVKGTKLQIEKQAKNAPLSQQMMEDTSVRATGRTKVRNRNDEDEEVSSSSVHLSLIKETGQTQN